MRLSRIITGKYHRNEAFPFVKCIRRYVQNGPLITLALVLCKSMKICTDDDFFNTFLFSVTLTYELMTSNLLH